jgi:hypothetical protein
MNARIRIVDIAGRVPNWPPLVKKVSSRPSLKELQQVLYVMEIVDCSGTKVTNKLIKNSRLKNIRDFTHLNLNKMFFTRFGDVIG